MNKNKPTRMYQRPTRGFTLIEIMVVVAIIIILMAILIPALKGARDTAKKAATMAQMKSIAQACEQYHGDFNHYPGPLNENWYGGSPVPTDPSSPPGYSSSQSMLLGLSLRWYADPTQVPTGSTAQNIPGTPWPAERAMTYQPVSYSPNGNKTYTAYLPFKQTDIATDTTTWPGVDKYPVLVDSSGFKGDARPILYYRMANKWSPDRGSGSAQTTTLSAGYARNPTDHDATSASAPAYFYVAANEYFTKHQLNSTLPDGSFDQTVLANLTDRTRTNQNGVTAAANTDWIPSGGFVLISAGLDRLYGPDANGNSDDLILSGGD